MNIISNKDFDAFVSKIDANKSEIDQIISTHSFISDVLKKQEVFKGKLEKTRLTGSYARKTNIKTDNQNGKKIDVDLGLIFRVSDKQPNWYFNEIYIALDGLEQYSGRVKHQSRSIGIELVKAHIDIVPFKQAEEGKDNPLKIKVKGSNSWKEN